MDIVNIGDATLYHGDCMDILPTLGKVDAVVTDPPYGINESGGEKARYRDGDGRTRFAIPKHELFEWDNNRPDQYAFDLMIDISDYQVIFGGNYFADLLPASMGWLYWDKKMGGDFSDGELIYTNRKAAVRSYSVHPFTGLKGGKDREHPTQKPVSVMRWAMSQLKDANTILDPFMGSGTTGVACAHTHTFIGIEKERKYFDIACERIDAAYAQGRLAL